MFKEEFQPTFEIDLVIRDSLGRPTKQRKSHVSNDGFGIYEFFQRYQGKPKRKKNKAKKNS